MSEQVVFLSQWFGKRHTALMIVRSLAIWISALMMLAVMAAPAYFHGKEFSGATVITALVLLATAQAAQALTLYVWTKPDHRKVIWDPETKVLTAFDWRVTQKFWSLGRAVPEFQLPLQEIREVTFQPGRGSQLRFTTNLGFLLLTGDLRDFSTLKDLMLEAVQNQPKRASKVEVGMTN
ncbi:MAG: hypothetical protein ABJZ55_22710 [Fuerstiella sp.]